METTLTDALSAQPRKNEDPAAKIIWRKYQIFFLKNILGFSKQKCNYYDVTEAGWRRVTEMLGFLEANKHSYNFVALIKVGEKNGVEGDIYSLWDPATQEFGQNLYASNLQS